MLNEIFGWMLAIIGAVLILGAALVEDVTDFGLTFGQLFGFQSLAIIAGGVLLLLGVPRAYDARTKRMRANDVFGFF